MKSFLLLAAVISCAFGINEQNLCGTRTDPNLLVFVNDPAGCSNYLWCNFNATNFLESVHQGTCPTGFLFNPTASACDAQHTCGTEVCAEADVVTEEALRVADVTDTTCRNFFFCRNGAQDTTMLTCNEPLVFNRNFGLCTSEEEAPCAGGGGGGGGTPGTCTEPGFFDNSAANQNCADFYVCDEDLIKTELSCNAPNHFNPATGGCQRPELRDPICPFTTTLTYGPHIPSPPLINAPLTIEQQLRNRFARMFRN